MGARMHRRAWFKCVRYERSVQCVLGEGWVVFSVISGVSRERESGESVGWVSVWQ